MKNPLFLLVVLVVLASALQASAASIYLCASSCDGGSTVDKSFFCAVSIPHAKLCNTMACVCLGYPRSAVLTCGASMRCVDTVVECAPMCIIPNPYFITEEDWAVWPDWPY